MNYHKGREIQRGRGLGSFLSGLFRTVAPYAKTGLKQTLKSGSKFVKSKAVKKIGKKALKELANTAVEISADAMEGKKINKQDIKNRLQKARKNIAKTVRANAPYKKQKSRSINKKRGKKGKSKTVKAHRGYGSVNSMKKSLKRVKRLKANKFNLLA